MLLDRAERPGGAAGGAAGGDLKVAAARNSLAVHYKAVGRVEEAEALYRLALEAQDAQLGSEHKDTITTRYNLAELLLATDREDEANAVQQEILEAVGATVEEEEGKEEQEKKR